VKKNEQLPCRQGCELLEWHCRMSIRSSPSQRWLMAITTLPRNWIEPFYAKITGQPHGYPQR
jgi:hypothetical protein